MINIDVVRIHNLGCAKYGLDRNKWKDIRGCSPKKNEWPPIRQIIKKGLESNRIMSLLSDNDGEFMDRHTGGGIAYYG